MAARRASIATCWSSSPEIRQLDNLKDAVRASLAWGEIVRDTERLNLTQSDSALAKAKLAEANETMKTRLKEAWCYLHYPAQESAQADVEWVSGKIPAQDGLLARASKKLVAEEGLLTELGPTRLDRDLQKYIWNGKPHLSLKDLREYLNRYIYLPRLKNQEVLIKAVQAAVSRDACQARSPMPSDGTRSRTSIWAWPSSGPLTRQS